MLPDFIAVKRRLSERLQASINPMKNSSSFVSTVNHTHAYEGDGFSVHREQGDIALGTYETYEQSVQISLRDIQEKGFAPVLAALNDLREQMTSAIEKEMISRISEACDEVGNTVHSRGQPFTIELFLDLLERLEFQFDQNGQWQKPSLVIHPNQSQEFRVQFERLENEPDLQQRVTEIIDRKRDEWHDRETHRKLVD